MKSRRNEAALLQDGAVEYGRTNTMVLGLCHAIFYLSCYLEFLVSGAVFNAVTVLGLVLFAFSMAMLFLVVRGLGRIWTIKLYIAPHHEFVQSYLFKNFRHPNYFLNILPELIGIALICQAWYTLLIGLPLYLIPLVLRIRQEERVMKEKVLGFS